MDKPQEKLILLYIELEVKLMDSLIEIPSVDLDILAELSRCLLASSITAFGFIFRRIGLLEDYLEEGLFKKRVLGILGKLYIFCYLSLLDDRDYLWKMGPSIKDEDLYLVYRRTFEPSPPKIEFYANSLLRDGDESRIPMLLRWIFTTVFRRRKAEQHEDDVEFLTPIVSSVFRNTADYVLGRDIEEEEYNPYYFASEGYSEEEIDG
ncbi:hypothetical protein ACFLZ3_00500 [Candidatus Omnitrophota bacterium]